MERSLDDHNKNKIMVAKLTVMRTDEAYRFLYLLLSHRYCVR